MCLRRIIKSQSTTLNNHWADILKTITRYTSDKSIEVRTQAAKCFKAISHSMQGTRHYEDIYQASLKGFEDNELEVRDKYVEALAIAMANGLYECTSNEILNSPSRKRSSKATSNFIDVCNAFLGVINNEYRQCSVLCIWKIMNQCPIQLKLTKPPTILQSILTIISKSSSYPLENYKTRLYFSWLLIEYIKLLDLPAQLKLKDVILSNLNNVIQQVQKTSEQQVIVLLTSFSALILQLGSYITEIPLNEITDTLIPFFSWKTPQVNIAAIECIKALMHSSPSWAFQLLSLFLNMTTVSYAELATLSPSLPFAGELKDSFMTLSVQGSCLTSILYHAKKVFHGVPLDIANSVLSSAKSIILGYNEEEVKSTPKKKAKELIVKRAAGWIIIQGLLGLGKKWVSTHLSGLIKLWTRTFKTEKEEDADTILQDFIVKSESLKALNDLIDNYKTLLNQERMLSITTILINVSSYLLDNIKELKKTVFDQYNVKYMQMNIVTL